MKKISVIAAAVLASVSLCACNVSTHSTTTTTVTTTDANGNVSTTTTVTGTGNLPEGSCIASLMDGQEHSVPVSIKNSTGSDITGLYICEAGASHWDNLFTDGDSLEDGYTYHNCAAISYSAGNPLSFDIGIRDADGEMHEFDEIDISNYNAEGFTITFEHGENGYIESVGAEYIM